ncbi:MAG: hypothetical protein M0R80_26285 [Proteobacteria bacterium]|nr:hypothetical protein [Pseudomonadota bacterium]
MFTYADLGLSEEFFDKEPKIRKETYENLKKMWASGVQAFLNEIAQYNLVHVLSGMSRASLIPLAREVRMMTAYRAKVSEDRFQAIGNVLKGWTDMSGTWHREGYRSISHGIREGDHCYILDFGDISNWVFKFEFKINVYQWYLHEMGYTYGSAWNALPQANAAFNNEIDNLLPMIVNESASKFFETGSVRV